MKETYHTIGQVHKGLRISLKQRLGGREEQKANRGTLPKTYVFVSSPDREQGPEEKQDPQAY